MLRGPVVDCGGFAWRRGLAACAMCLSLCLRSVARIILPTS